MVGAAYTVEYPLVEYKNDQVTEYTTHEQQLRDELTPDVDRVLEVEVVEDTLRQILIDLFRIPISSIHFDNFDVWHFD